MPDCNWDVDSQLFQYMGYAMLNGKVPYTDYFDNKGLLLYALNALGWLISPRWGVMLLQSISLGATLAACYHGIGFIRDTRYRLAIILLFPLCLYAYSGIGDLCEEWSLPLICAAWAIYTRSLYVTRRDIGCRGLFCIGLCVGCLLLLRVNNSVPVVTLLLWCAGKAVTERKWKYLRKGAAVTAAGVSLPLLAAAAYMFAANGWQGVEDMWWSNVTWNMLQSRSKLADPLHRLLRPRFFYKAVLPVAMACLAWRNRKQLVAPLCLATFLAMLTTGGNDFYSYLMVMLPMTVFAMACLDGSRWRLAAVALMALLYAKTVWRQFSPEHFRPRSDNPTLVVADLLKAMPPAEPRHLWGHNGVLYLKALAHNHVLLDNRMFYLNKNPLHVKTFSEAARLRRTKPAYIFIARYKEKWLDAHDDWPSVTPFLNSNYDIAASRPCNGDTLYLYKRR